MKLYIIQDMKLYIIIYIIIIIIITTTITTTTLSTPPPGISIPASTAPETFRVKHVYNNKSYAMKVDYPFGLTYAVGHMP